MNAADTIASRLDWLLTNGTLSISGATAAALPTPRVRRRIRRDLRRRGLLPLRRALSDHLQYRHLTLSATTVPRKGSANPTSVTREGRSMRGATGGYQPPRLSRDCVSVNGTNISQYCSAATVESTFEELDTTTFGGNYRQFTQGLGDATITLTTFPDTSGTVNGIFWPLSQSGGTFALVGQGVQTPRLDDELQLLDERLALRVQPDRRCGRRCDVHGHPVPQRRDRRAHPRHHVAKGCRVARSAPPPTKRSAPWVPHERRAQWRALPRMPGSRVRVT